MAREQYDVTICGLIPAAFQSDANALSVKLGFGSIYTVPCSFFGTDPATYYGFSAWARTSFDSSLDETVVQKDANRLVRDDKPEITQTEKDTNVIQSAIFSRNDFDAMLQENSLSRIALQIEEKLANIKDKI